VAATDRRSGIRVDRKERLEQLVSQILDPWLCYTETFRDGATLGLADTVCMLWWPLRDAPRVVGLVATEAPSVSCG